MTGQSAPAINFSFNISKDCKASAGVYNSSGVLVRTIWSMVPYPAGKHVSSWDGHDDFGDPATGAPFTIKILCSNTNYIWEGVIGNTSDKQTGSTVLRSIRQPTGMAVAGENLYWSLGYAEAWPSSWKTKTRNLNTKTWIQVAQNNGSYQNDFVITDGKVVYWAAYDPGAPSNSFVYGTKVTDDKIYHFSAGIPMPQTHAPVYESVIGYLKDTTGSWKNSIITGLAVQKTGNFLFLARGGLNELMVLNKLTGALIKTISITNPGRLAVDNDGNLWMAYGGIIQKFSVGESGMLISARTIIPLHQVGGLAVSPDGNTIIAADISSRQVKGYSVSSGSISFTLGTGVSYSKNARVENDKFYWSDLRGSYPTFLCYLPDGSFLVGDSMNFRVQHFAADRSFLNSLCYLGNQYQVHTDINNPTRLFGMLCEFSIDYKKPIASCWKLVNNWGGNFLPEYDQSEQLINPVTLANGRTYALVRKGPSRTVVELVAGAAMRYTSITFPNPDYNPVQNKIDHDGNLLSLYETAGFDFGTRFIMKRFALTGFDSQNNPIWASSPKSVTTTPLVGSNSVKGNSGLDKTANGNFIHFDAYRASPAGPRRTGWGYHIGAIPEGGDSYKWGSAQSTNRDNYKGPYPGRGNYMGHWFDSGNGVNYPGGFVAVNGDQVFWSYHGENWKGGQTNLFVHLYDKNIGLAAGSFGTSSYDHPNNIFQFKNNGGREEAIWAGAGNAQSGQLVSVNRTLYLWHGDESYHGGIHRWRIEGLDSITLETASIGGLIKTEGIDLLAGLVSGGKLVNGMAGWSRYPADDFNDAKGKMITAIGNKSLDPDKSPSLFIQGNLNTPGVNCWVKRSLQNNLKLNGWIITADLLYDLNQSSDNMNSGSFLEVLDINNMIILQFYPYNIGSGTNQIRANGKVMVSTDQNSLVNTLHSWTDFVVEMRKNIISVRYGSYNPVQIRALDARADINIPAFITWSFFSKTGAGVQARGRSIAIQKLRFNPRQESPQ